MIRVVRTLILALGAAATPAAMAMDFADLQRLIDEHHVKSIEQLLPLLPAELRSRYVLMFRSRSLHGSDFAHPRAILFERGARFVVSFNGDAGQAGFHALETMQFDDRSMSFQFREVNFPGEGRAAVISPPNPGTCVKCHGQPARPVWDTHPTWPGAYGERDGAGLSTEERSGLRQFLISRPDHPRYRYLLDVERFSNPQTFRPDWRDRYGNDEHPPPNAELSAALGRLNFQAIVHQLEAMPQFESNKYLLLGAIGADCGWLPDFFPESQRSAAEAGFGRFAAESAGANFEQSHSKQLRLTESTRAARRVHLIDTASDIESMDRFRFVVEHQFQLSTSQWTTALEKRTYDFTWSPTASAEMAAFLRRRIAQGDAEVAVRTLSDPDRYCGYLRRRSRAALAGVEALAPAAPGSQIVEAAANGPALLSQCKTCHLGDVGPRLPFDQPERLAGQLTQGQFPRGNLLEEIRWRLGPEAGQGRMPLGTNLSQSERQTLIAYLSALSSQRVNGH
jgi:cytochrome c553